MFVSVNVVQYHLDFLIVNSNVTIQKRQGSYLYSAGIKNINYFILGISSSGLCTKKKVLVKGF